MNVINFQNDYNDLCVIVEKNGNASNKETMLSQFKEKGFNIDYDSFGTIHLSKDNIAYSVGFDYSKKKWFLYKSFWVAIRLPKGNKHYAQLSTFIKPHQIITLHVDDGNGLQTMDFNIDDENVGI